MIAIVCSCADVDAEEAGRVCVLLLRILQQHWNSHGVKFCLLVSMSWFDCGFRLKCCCEVERGCINLEVYAHLVVVEVSSDPRRRVKSGF